MIAEVGRPRASDTFDHCARFDPQDRTVQHVNESLEDVSIGVSPDDGSRQGIQRARPRCPHGWPGWWPRPKESGRGIATIAAVGTRFSLDSVVTASIRDHEGVCVAGGTGTPDLGCRAETGGWLGLLRTVTMAAAGMDVDQTGGPVAVSRVRDRCLRGQGRIPDQGLSSRGRLSPRSRLK